ncbi:MAG: ATP-binding protein [Anaerolineae bacterium]|nr:ATP-binding protein [Anaerolineae bacterium]
MDNSILTRYPQNLAKLYEAARLEGEPRLRVSKLVDLYEATVRHLALVGLAACDHFGRADAKVEAARGELARPSLGHWVALAKAVDEALGQEFPLLAPPLNQRHSGDAVAEAVEVLAPMAGREVPKRIRFSFFLDVVVEFRNRKIGHGSLSPAEARRAVEPLEAALAWWLGELALLRQRPLLYIGRVEWQDPHFVYSGTNLSAGTSLYPARLEGQAPITPRQVYLGPAEGADALALIPLHPFFAFDGDTSLLHVYSELSSQGRPLLRCPYEASSLKGSLELDLPAERVLGKGGPPAPQGEPERPDSDEPEEPEPLVQVRKVGSMIKGWYDVIQPHEDIRKGHFDESIFAADLGDVADGIAAADYSDPYLFFKKTYPTRGLTSLLGRVHTKLTSGQGPSVIQIQTPFGGGKTHALVAIYHYLKHGDRIEGLLPDLPASPFQGGGRDGGLAVVAGNHWDPVAGRTTRGITRRTFWGEVAYQIGGEAGYEVFRQNDEARISPGKDKLRAFLADHQPFVLLFDEILEYVNRALDRRAGGDLDVSLGTQTFSFFQELTETVASLPRAMLIVTLPSSHLEDFGEKQEESLARLNKIFGRVEAIETPVQGEEVYAVIRRRLFEEETLRRVQMREIVHRYFQLYAQHRDDLPAKAREANYRDKLEMAYPFHPDVVDILYEKWSTYPTFQRTRGVLRLLANVVEDLYQREVPLDLILPGDLNLEQPSIRQEFLKHIGPEYEGIIGSDIAGHEAKAQALDRVNRQWSHLAQRVSAAIFFHSFSADDSEKGVSLPYVKLATLRSDAIPAMVTDVLQRLANELWYLNTRADAYYFSRIPNLNRMILDKKELFNESYEEAMREIIEKEIGRRFRAYLWPETGDGIPDNRELKLVILRPEDGGAQIPAWIERRGESFREYKNTLFFALADTGAFVKLREDVKTHLALQEIKAGVDSGETPQLETKRDEIQRRMHAITRDFSYNVRRMYHTLRYGGREVDLGQPVAGTEALSHWYWRELTSGDVGAIVEQLHYRTLVNKLLAGNETVATGVILDQFYKNPELPVPAGEEVVARAIQLGVKEGALGLAEVRDGEVVPETLRYQADVPLAAVSFEPGMHLVSRATCQALLAAMAPPEQPAEGPGPDVEVLRPGVPVAPPPGPGAHPTPPSPGVTPPAETRYQRVRLVVADVPASKIADVNRGILLPISAAVGDFTFTLEIDVESAEGITPATLETKIKETIRQIGARVVEEETEQNADGN